MFTTMEIFFVGLRTGEKLECWFYLVAKFLLKGEEREPAVLVGAEETVLIHLEIKALGPATIFSANATREVFRVVGTAVEKV